MSCPNCLIDYEIYYCNTKSNMCTYYHLDTPMAKDSNPNTIELRSQDCIPLMLKRMNGLKSAHFDLSNLNLTDDYDIINPLPNTSIYKSTCCHTYWIKENEDEKIFVINPARKKILTLLSNHQILLPKNYTRLINAIKPHFDNKFGWCVPCHVTLKNGVSLEYTIIIIITSNMVINASSHDLAHYERLVHSGNVYFLDQIADISFSTYAASPSIRQTKGSPIPWSDPLYSLYLKDTMKNSYRFNQQVMFLEHDQTGKYCLSEADIDIDDLQPSRMQCIAPKNFVIAHINKKIYTNTICN